MHLKKATQLNTLTCERMMFWRGVGLVAAIPFVAQQLASFSESSLAAPSWLIAIPCLPLLLMLYYMFRLVNKTSGTVNASFHVLLTAALTPIFLIGPLLIPLLVRGDARRLLIVGNTENAK